MPYSDPDKRREAARRRSARYRARNATAIAERRKTPEALERGRASSQRWRERNRDKSRAYTRDYDKEHRTPCIDCGALKKRQATRCLDCEKKRRYSGGFLRQGYRFVKAPDGHPGATKLGYIGEHRLVAEQHLGRPLLPDEHVHHINGVRDDNRPENLEVWVSHHPKGQRPGDLVEWAQEILRRYAPDRAAEGW